MTSAHAARPPLPRGRRRRLGVATLLAAGAATAVAALAEVPAASSPGVPVLRGTDPGPARGLGEAGGAVPAGTTAFDDDVPGVAQLDPALLDALRRATATARADGVRLAVDSGWRSAAYQARLRREAVATYGSEEEAARWVATPETSAHVSGDAVDVGPAAGAAWLSRHGAAFGLCPVYANEPWHFELRPGAAGGGCGPVYPDPTADPRMHR